MSVYRVLDKLEAYVHEGTWLPAGYRVLSEERLLELLEKIRASLPEEVGRAKVIAKDHERMMRAAQEKAQAIVNEAASKHEELLDDNEIVRRARAAADAALNDAQENARKVREGADQYATGRLGRDGGPPRRCLGRGAQRARSARRPAKEYRGRPAARRGCGQE